VIPEARLTPLINYFPLLRAQETVEVPFRYEFFGPATNAAGQGKFAKTPCGKPKCFGYDIDANGNVTAQPGRELLANYLDFNKYPCTGGAFDLDRFAALLKAIVDACAQCQDLKDIVNIAADHIGDGVSEISEGLMAAFNVMDTIGKLTGKCPGGGGGGGGGGGSGPGSSSAPARSNSGYSPGGLGCFVAGTTVLLADGTVKPIEAVTTNDVVRTGPTRQEAARVAQVEVREAKELCEVVFVRPGSAADTASVTATPDHSFWVDGSGWVAARHLKAGDWLFNSSGQRVGLRAINRLETSGRVYTLVNREDHAFYANDILVQDSCGDKTPWLASRRAAPGQEKPVQPRTEVQP